MSFDEAIRSLRSIAPGAELGLTATRGQYFEQAQYMDFERFDDRTFSSRGSQGKTMWLYIGKGGKIYCGNKDY
ncbi:MAG TPA: hypothetical protein VKX17_03580 [Planctomycetota bacterium]|nr:hypothetical protein [Planctomycetota bacterium]